MGVKLQRKKFASLRVDTIQGFFPALKQTGSYKSFPLCENG